MGWTPRKHGELPRARAQSLTTASRPLARSEHLVVEELGNELFVYDKRHDLAHCLGETAASVWQACDGTRSRSELATDLGVEPATIDRALEELDGWELLDSGPTFGPRHTRREMSIKVAKVSAAAALTPVLMSSIVAPAAAQSASEIQRCFDLVGPTDNCGNQCHQGCCCCCNACPPAPSEPPTSPQNLCNTRPQGVCTPRGMNPTDYCQATLSGTCTGGGFGSGCP